MGTHLFFVGLLSLITQEGKAPTFSKVNLEVSFLQEAKEERRTPEGGKVERTLKRSERRGEELGEKGRERTLEEREDKWQDHPTEVPPLPLPAQTEAVALSLNLTPSLPIEGEIPKKEENHSERVLVASPGSVVSPTDMGNPSDGLMKRSPSLPANEPVLIQPRYASNPKPPYPKEAKRLGFEGEVLLRVEVLSNGRVGEIEVKRSSGYKILDQSAVAAVKEWRFIPARMGETPVSVWVNIPVLFRLR
ncbi:MAG: energy transducer TonB [Desulfobacterota bacterium]|nr:energy transducer TonB [Thermodesulfobacteriota bacterium]